MRQTKLALAVMAAAILTACGSGSPTGGDQSTKVKFSAQVTFGDSLADVGTYAVGTIKNLGGGKFTINGNNTAINPALTGKNWTELMAAQFSLSAPCPAMTGLDGDASQGFKVPVATYTGCYGYAQGGARVTNPVGPGNKFTGSPVGALSSAATAAGTTAGTQAFGASLVAQLAAGAPNPQTAAQAIGLALATESARPGHTDTTVVQAAVTAAVLAGNAAVASPAVYGPMVVKAQADGAAAGAKAGADYAAAHAPELVQAMATAGTDLVTLVKSQLVGNGAKYVTVNNLPDASITPYAMAQSTSNQQLVAAMVKAFNDALSAGLSNVDGVLLVDLFYLSHDQAVNPAPYGLTNVKDTACDLSPAKNPLDSSLVCNGSNLKAGDVSHYAFADDVHPTPFLNQLLARYVSEKLVIKGWL